MRQSASSPDTAKRSAPLFRRATTWVFGAVGIITLSLLLRLLVFVPVRCDAVVDPPLIVPGERKPAVIQLACYGRLGLKVPGQSPRFRCMADEGAGLVSWEYNADSTAVTVRSTGDRGTVIFRLVSPAWPFPVYARLAVDLPSA